MLLVIIFLCSDCHSLVLGAISKDPPKPKPSADVSTKKPHIDKLPIGNKTFIETEKYYHSIHFHSEFKS
jgi:hypothetical protein